jgi:hypothetical protein
VVDADSQHLLWTALRWAAAALHQIERVRDSWEGFRGRRLVSLGALPSHPANAQARQCSSERWTGDSGINRPLWILKDLEVFREGVPA